MKIVVRPSGGLVVADDGRDDAGHLATKRRPVRCRSAEQQVQRYESTGYRSASLARILDIAAALGITITERAELHNLHVA